MDSDTERLAKALILERSRLREQIAQAEDDLKELTTAKIAKKLELSAYQVRKVAQQIRCDARMREVYEAR